MSVPLRMGKRILAHHTLLVCTGPDTPPVQSRVITEFDDGAVVWARGHQLPGWPGKIISHADSAPVPDKVGSQSS